MNFWICFVVITTYLLIILKITKGLIMNEILLTREAAKILRVSNEHLRDLIKAGKINAYKEGRRGGYRILRKEIDNYIQSKHAEILKPKACFDKDF